MPDNNDNLEMQPPKLARTFRRFLPNLPGLIVLVALLIVLALVVRPRVTLIDTRAADAWPMGTFHTQNLIVDEAATVSPTSGSVFGHGNTQARELINGPTLQQFAVPNTAYTFGEVNQAFISGVVPIFPNDLFVWVIKNSAAADTTTHTSHSGAIAAEVSSVRSAGGNDLTNTAIECTAINGQVNECFHALAGDVTLDGGSNLTVNSGFIFMTDSTKFIASLGTIFAESSGTNAIDITGTPTNQIKTRAAISQFDVDNVSLTTALTFYNANAGRLRVNFGLDATPTNLNIISPIVPTGASHGTLSARATDWNGRITSIGANTSVLLTYSSTFPNGSECSANPIAHAVTPQFIEPVGGAASVTFSCFTTTTGAAANCDDFTYQCIGN